MSAMEEDIGQGLNNDLGAQLSTEAKRREEDHIDGLDVPDYPRAASLREYAAWRAKRAT